MNREGDFAELARRVLAGDESMETARALEAALLDQYLGDERLDDLLEALSLFAPGSGRPYYEPKELREVVREAIRSMPGNRREALIKSGPYTGHVLVAELDEKESVIAALYKQVGCQREFVADFWFETFEDMQNAFGEMGWQAEWLIE